MSGKAWLESLVGTEPRMVQAGTGHRWLALSPQDKYPRIGVIGNSEFEARRAYQESAAMWDRGRDRNQREDRARELLDAVRVTE